MKRRFRLTVLAIALLMASAPVAQAAEDDPPNVVCLLSPILESAVTLSGTRLAPVCVDLTVDAVSIDDATGDIVRGRAVLATMLGVAEGDELTIVGKDFTGSEFNGRKLWWTVDNNEGCRGENRYAARSMPNGFKDSVSSARGYNQCFTFLHFEHAGLQGASLNCYSCWGDNGMGVMNDATSSVYFE